MFENLKMVERQCHQNQNFQSLLSRNDFYGERTFYHITAVCRYMIECTFSIFEKIELSIVLKSAFHGGHFYIGLTSLAQLISELQCVKKF